jgi:hypothetical protein
MSDEEKNSGFTVSDRRLFTEEGELRPDAPPEPAPEATQPVAPPQTTTPEQLADSGSKAPAGDLPPPPTAAEQEASSTAYKSAHAEVDKALNEALGTQHRPESLQANFESFIASLYMSAMMQLGLMHERGEQPQVDLVGARHTIDTLAMLEEKTRGNLAENEKALLQDALFRLRMAFVEMTNVLTRTPPPGAPPNAPPGDKK